MSSLVHKPTIEGMPPASATHQPVRRAQSPAFKPQFKKSFRAHPRVAIGVALVVFVLLLMYAMRQKPMYYAESLVYIEPVSAKVLADGTGGGFDISRYESMLQQQMQTAQRIDIVTSALETLPTKTWDSFGGTVTVAAQNIQTQLKIQRVTTSYQVSIGLKGPDAGHTAAIVNAVTQAYLQAGRKDELTASDERTQLLTEERGRIEQDLTKTRAEQAVLSGQLGVANPTGEGTNRFDTQLDNLRTQLTAARTTHEIAAAQLAVISGSDVHHASGLSSAANEAIAGDPGLGAMKATINERRAILIGQMAALTPTNPVYKQDQDELADLDKMLDQTTTQVRDKAARGLQDKLRTDLERTGDIEGRLNAEVARQTATATNNAPRLQRASELTADVQRLELRYATVDNALHSLQLETTGPGMVHLALAAPVPTAPEPNRKMLLELAALPMACLCGLAAAVFFRKRDHRVYGAGEIDDVLGFAPIAILPSADEVSEAVLQEYYLRLAAGVESAYRKGGAQSFLLTAVSVGTEIRELVERLQITLSQLGLAVLVAEGSLLVQGGVDAGTERHAEGVAPALLQEMKAEHDVVLLQAPALLYSGQAEYVARCADATMLVVESSVTTHEELYRSVALLQRLNVRGVAAILNALRLRYADASFVRAVQELERRAPVVSSQPVRRQRAAEQVEVDEPSPVAVEEPVPLPEKVPVAEAEEAVASEPERFDSVVAAAPVMETPGEAIRAEARPPESGAVLEGERMSTGNWFQRIIGREAEPVVSILPDGDDDTAEGTPIMASVVVSAASAPVVERELAWDLPVQEAAPEIVEAAAPVAETPEPVVVDAWPVPSAEVAAPEPIVLPAPVVEARVPARPLSFLELTQMNQHSIRTDGISAEVAAPVLPVRVEPVTVVEQVEVPVVVETVEPVPVVDEPLVVEAHEVLAEIEEPAAAVQPEWSLVRAEVVTELEPVAQASNERAEPVTEATPEPVVEHAGPVLVQVAPPVAEAPLEEWVPTPLNRWDPIPPLRAQHEPWRASRISPSAGVAVPSANDEVWGKEDPVRIPPTDRWGTPEASYPADTIPENSEIVLTRRWGLLSRFQQGEGFAARAKQPESNEQEAARPGYGSRDRRG